MATISNICQPHLRSILQSVVSRFLFTEEINNMCGANTYLNELFREDWRYVYRICRHIQPHNYEGEAIVNNYGQQRWYKEGKLHRGGDQPARIDADGTQFWYKEGTIHREGDKPAKIFANGSQEWWKEGKIHRDGDQPAVIDERGTQYWYKGWNLHRDGDQPAIICANGTRTWWIEGRRIK